MSLDYGFGTMTATTFSGRRHKMTHKGWRVVKLQNNQSIKYFYKSFNLLRDLLFCNPTL